MCWDHVMKWASWPHRLQGGFWKDARCELQAWRECGTEPFSVQNIKSHLALDDIVDGSLAWVVLGNDRADEFARKGAELHASDSAWPRHRRRSRRLTQRPARYGSLVRRTQRPRSWPRRPCEDRWRCSRCLVGQPTAQSGGKSPGSLLRITSVLVGGAGRGRGD